MANFSNEVNNKNACVCLPRNEVLEFFTKPFKISILRFDMRTDVIYILVECDEKDDNCLTVCYEQVISVGINDLDHEFLEIQEYYKGKRILQIDNILERCKDLILNENYKQYLIDDSQDNFMYRMLGDYIAQANGLNSNNNVLTDSIARYIKDYKLTSDLNTFLLKLEKHDKITCKVGRHGTTKVLECVGLTESGWNFYIKNKESMAELLKVYKKLPIY